MTVATISAATCIPRPSGPVVGRLDENQERVISRVASEATRWSKEPQANDRKTVTWTDPRQVFADRKDGHGSSALRGSWQARHGGPRRQHPNLTPPADMRHHPRPRGMA